MNNISGSVEETGRIAEDFLKKIEPSETNAVVVGLYGELGSGKTTFTKSLAKSLGIKETVTSPTFVIEKIYRLSGGKFKNLVHIDAYRLKSGGELTSLGWDDIINDPDNLILVEWAENVDDVFPKNAIKIKFSHKSEMEREIEIENA